MRGGERWTWVTSTGGAHGSGAGRETTLTLRGLPGVLLNRRSPGGHMRQHHITRIVLLAIALVTAVVGPALAGPPLVCVPYDIGTARSLPWDADGHAWKGMRADYRVSQLTGDTLALLTPGTPIIVRMETLRRAALYATRNTGIARDLLTTLLDRAKSKGADSLASFDAGYLLETYKQ